MCPASGKTTVCDKIIQRLHDQCVVMLNQDSFYRSLTQVGAGTGLATHHATRSSDVLHVDTYGAVPACARF
jgi:uridine kinase